MRAVVYDNGVNYVASYPDAEPRRGECLVRVHWAGICATDLEIVKGYMGFKGVLGHEFVGTVESGSRGWRGRRVVGEINCACGTCDLCHGGLATHCRNRSVIGISGHDGCFADFVAVPEINLHEVPAGISDEEAVFVEPLAAAYQVLKQCPIESRTHVAVVGTGRLGLLVVQLLAAVGCRLLAVGRNPGTLLFCEKKHIQAVSTDDLVPRQDRDVVVECTGSADGFNIAMQMLRPRGTLVLKSTFADAGSLNLAPVVINEINVLGSRCGPFGDALAALVRKEIDVSSMVSRTFQIDQAGEALSAAADPRNIKVLLKINPR
ncbi:MAG: alcohol dehydrogenase catalytic domain-containing protein [Phycisphaerae bacterium]|nr:alcohol dehydrogenase catalytic domain-containing protein [Phycisphaerae bacterium]